jgi:hypothetical protein
VIRASLFVTVACVVALVASGCGSSPKPVTKAQYEQKVQQLGADLVRAGSQVGQHLDISTFNEDISNLQNELRDASKELKGVKPPTNAQGPNEQLAGGLHDLADQLEPVKDARRKSLPEGARAFRTALLSAPARQGRQAVRQLKRQGYDVGQMAAL